MIETVNEFCEVRFKNYVEKYLKDGYTILSTSCEPDAAHDMVWAAIMFKKDEAESE